MQNHNFQSVKKKESGYKRRNDFQINNAKMKKKKIEVELNALVLKEKDLENEELMLIEEENNNNDHNSHLQSNNNPSPNKSKIFNYSRNIPSNNTKLSFNKNRSTLSSYKNMDKTLTEKFVSKFTDRMQREIENQKLEDYKRKLEIMRNEERKRFNFLHNLRLFSDDIDNIEIEGVNKDQNEKKEIPTVDNSKWKNSNFFTKIPITTTSSHKKSYSTMEQTNIFITKTENPSKFQKSIHTSNSNKYKNTKIVSKSISPFQSFVYEESRTIPITPVNIKFPRQNYKKSLPIKINNFTKSLNAELGRISKSYGKIEAFKRFKENPVTQYYFENNNYLAYRTAKITENKEMFRAKLKPLIMEADPGIERLTQSVFNMRSNLVKTIRDFMKEGRKEVKEI